MKRRNYGTLIRDKTGLVIDAYFSASKPHWILGHVEGAREAARRGELLCGTVDAWLLWKLSNGKRRTKGVYSLFHDSVNGTSCEAVLSSFTATTPPASDAAWQVMPSPA